jgi:hypothetical protein
MIEQDEAAVDGVEHLFLIDPFVSCHWAERQPSDWFAR